MTLIIIGIILVIIGILCIILSQKTNARRRKCLLSIISLEFGLVMLFLGIIILILLCSP